MKYFINEATSDVPFVLLNTSNLYKSVALMMFDLLKTTKKKLLLTAHTD